MFMFGRLLLYPPRSLTFWLSWLSPTKYIQCTFLIIAVYWTNQCCNNSFAACLLPHRSPKGYAVSRWYSLPALLCCFLVSAREWWGQSLNTTAVHILHSYNNLFHVSWLTWCFNANWFHVCIILRLRYMISRNCSENICIEVLHRLISTQETSVYMCFFMPITSKYCQSIRLGYCSSVLVVNIFTNNWFNGAICIFDHNSGEGRMCVGHSWYFVNWSEPIGWSEWCGVTFLREFNSHRQILGYTVLAGNRENL